MRKLKTDDAEPVAEAETPLLNKKIKRLDMTKLIKLFTLAVLWLASLLPAAAEIDLFEIKAALVLGKTTIIVPAEAKEEDLAAIKDCIKDAQGITLDLSATDVKDLGNVFSNCKALKSLILPKTLTSIADSAFSGYESLTSIVIPEGVTSIGDEAFYRCETLTLIKIPASVTSIGDRAFYGCTSLADKNGFVIVCGILFDYTLPAGFAGKPRNVLIIPASVTSIGDGAFFLCEPLTSVTFESPTDWYLDKELTKSVGSSGLSGKLKTGNALYKKSE